MAFLGVSSLSCHSPAPPFSFRQLPSAQFSSVQLGSPLFSSLQLLRSPPFYWGQESARRQRRLTHSTPVPELHAHASAGAVAASSSTQRLRLQVPLPESGPLAPPAWVLDCVKEQPWKGGLEPCGDVEYSLEYSEAVVEGELPPELNGSLYVCGPGRTRVGTSKFKHWFDGDGMVSGVHFGGPGQPIRVASKCVRTPMFKAQLAAGDADIVTRRAWTTAKGGLLANVGVPGNPGNTSALYFAGKLLALCEGGLPFEVDPESLETRGEVNFGGALSSSMGPFFSAHPKVDPVTGELINVGICVDLQNPKLGLAVYVMSPEGDMLRQTRVANGDAKFVHDMVISENYITMALVPWGYPDTAMLLSLLGIGNIGDSWQWLHPERGTRMLMLDRRTLAVVHDGHVPLFSTYHFANSWEAGGRLHVLVNRLNGPRESLERQFADMYASNWQAENYNTLWEFEWDLSSWELLREGPAVRPGGAAEGEGGRGGGGGGGWEEPVGMEFPVINPNYVGKKTRYIYVVTWSPTVEGKPVGFLKNLQKYDLETGLVVTHVLPDGWYPSEGRFIPRHSASVASGAAGAAGVAGGVEMVEDDGYYVGLVYDSERHASNVVVIDTTKFGGPPVAVIKLKTHVPYCFHGTWVANQDRVSS